MKALLPPPRAEELAGRPSPGRLRSPSSAYIASLWPLTPGGGAECQEETLAKTVGGKEGARGRWAEGGDSARESPKEGQWGEDGSDG